MNGFPQARERCSMAAVPDEYLAIRQLCERYADAVTRRDARAWLATWAPDGEWRYGGDDPPRGREALARFWEAALEDIADIVMLVHSGVVERVDGDAAVARWYHSEHVRVGDGEALAGVTLYEDELVRIDGDWRFARRRHRLLYSGPDLSGEFHSLVAPNAD